MKRISRGTPQFMTQTEVENLLASIRDDGALEEATAAAFDLTLDNWRKIPKAKRAAMFLQMQERGRFAASAAASLKARADFLETSFAKQAGIDDPRAQANRLDRLEQQLAELNNVLKGADK